MNDEDIRNSILEGDFAAILKNQNLRQKARDHKDDEALLRLNVEKVLGIR